MTLNKQMVGAMAEIGALRALILHAIALRILEEPDPSGALNVIEAQMTASATIPCEDAADLEPAMSDMLAAVTDERIETLLGDLRQSLIVMGAVQAAS